MKSEHFRFSVPRRRQPSKLVNLLIIIIFGLALPSSFLIRPVRVFRQDQNPQVSQVPQQTNLNLSSQWRLMTEEEQDQEWMSILNSPLGIVALNQLAIEGFISPHCPKTFYLSKQYNRFKTLLQVKCPTARGVSIASDYDEIRVIFSRFEDNIENFQVERFPYEQ